MRMLKIIVNADDLGISHEVNNCIERAIEERVITSTSLIVNAPFSDEGFNIARSHPEISVGIHLNLIEFSPLTNLELFKKRGIVDDSGCFIEGAIFATPITAELKKAIFEEWDAQLCEFESKGLTPSHIDSHQHTHTIPSLRSILATLMDKHGVSRVRRKYVPSFLITMREKINGPSEFLDKSKAVTLPSKRLIPRLYSRIKYRIVARRWNSFFSHHFSLTRQFYAYRIFNDNYRFTRKRGVIELMCHPGHNGYQKETTELFCEEIKRHKNIKLLSYYDI